MKIRIYVNGMKCEGCSSHVQEALNKVKGLKVISINLQEKYALVESVDVISENVISKAINNGNGKYTFVRIENENN